MKKNSARKMALNGLMIALVFLATYFTRIPTPLPGGYFNLGDSIIMLAAAFLGPVGGLAAGSIGSCFADLAAGALIFAPITLVVKGIEGLVVGLLINKYMKATLATGDRFAGNKAANIQGKGPMAGIGIILALVLGAVIMVAGYFSGEAFILSLFDKTFGIAAAAGELIANLIQGGLSAVVAYFLIVVLSKVDVQKYIM